MKKSTYKVAVEYTFLPDHKGAPYLFHSDNVYGNAGNLVERSVKVALGFSEQHDTNSRYDIASDIPELCASVKSSRFTLTNAPIGGNFDETFDNYFATCPSTEWIYGSITDDTLTIYQMNANEFAEFLRVWGYWDEYRGTIKGKNTSLKMLLWLDERVTARKTSNFLSTIRR